MSKAILNKGASNYNFFVRNWPDPVHTNENTNKEKWEAIEHASQHVLTVVAVDKRNYRFFGYIYSQFEIYGFESFPEL